jgi:hypothetical protein
MQMLGRRLTETTHREESGRKRHEQDQDDAHPEGRHRETEETDPSDHVVGRAVLFERRDDPERYREQEGEQEAEAQEPRRDGEALRDLRGDGLPRLVRVAEVAAGDALDVARVLDPHGIVETEFLPHLVEPLLRGSQSHDLSNGVTRRDLEDQEHEQHDPQQQRDGEQ